MDHSAGKGYGRSEKRRAANASAAENVLLARSTAGRVPTNIIKRKRGDAMAKHKLTTAQRLLQIHLAELDIETIPEFKFCSDRKFRMDLYCDRLRLGFEVNGQYQGLHGKRFGNTDNEKIRLAQLHGYRILPFSNQEVLDGTAREFMQNWLDNEEPQE